MSIRRGLDESYESGYRTARAGIPANAGCGPGKDRRYYEMAYAAGYQAALIEIRQLSAAVAARSEQP